MRGPPMRHELGEGKVSVGPENPYGPFMRFSRNILL
jgi:hypothetical protein